MKRATIAQVAQRAGVSPTAVSLVLNDRPARLSQEVRDRVIEAAAALNYRPNPAARSLRTNTTGIYGVISRDVTVTRYASAMLRGILDAADQAEKIVFLAEVGDSASRAENSVREMLNRNVDGLIFAEMGAKMITVPEIVRGLPMVVCNAVPDREGSFPAVLPAEYEAGRRVANVLIEAGHRNIAIIGMDDELREPRISATICHRFDGILDAFEEAGLRPVKIFPGTLWDPDLGYEAMGELLDNGPECTAILALNDRISLGAIQQCLGRGMHLPDDLSIASFDDDEIALYVHPALTTIAIPYWEIGQTATRLLGEEGAGDRDIHLVDMPLRMRESVRRI